MNTTICRIAAAAPLAVALLGFGIGSAHAAPYDPASADKVQMQPADEPHDWDIDLPISDDLPDGDPPVDPDDVGPAEPADDEGNDEESDEESDEDADSEPAESDNSGGATAGGSNGGSYGADKDGDQEESTGEAEQPGGTSRSRGTVEDAEVQVTPVSAAGVQVPTELVASAGVALAGVVGWAAYRRTKAFATA